MDNSLLTKAKTALRLTSTAYDDEITDLIESALLDLGFAGVVIPEDLTAVVRTAVITYVKVNFGSPDDYERLKKSYDEQKAQLATATGYTVWSDSDV